MGLKKIIEALNQPIGGSGSGNDKKSTKKREKNLQLKVMELTAQDAIKNTKNVRYRYKVRDKKGNITDGKLDALSKLDVHSFLMNQGYDVLSIEEDELFNKLGLVQLVTRPMKDKDFNYQLILKREFLLLMRLIFWPNKREIGRYVICINVLFLNSLQVRHLVRL